MNNMGFYRKAFLLIHGILACYILVAQKVDFSTKDTIVCKNRLATFVNKSTGTFPPTTVFVWDVHQTGNPPSKRKQNQDYTMNCNESGKMTITLTALDSVTDKVIGVMERKDYVFVVKPPIMKVECAASACAGAAVPFKAVQTGGDGKVVSYQWWFNDFKQDNYGQDSIFKRTYNSAVNDNIAVLGKLGPEYGGCATLNSEIAYTPITITDPKLKASFTASSLALCGGETGKEITFTNTSTAASAADIARYEWIVQELEPIKPPQIKTTVKSPSIQITTATNVKLKIYSSNNCVDSTQNLSINVYNFNSTFSVTDAIITPQKKLICPDTAIYLSAGNGTFTTVKWTITEPDGNIINATTGSFYALSKSKPGVYSVDYTVSASSCPGGSKDYVGNKFTVEDRNPISVKDTYHSCKPEMYKIPPTAPLAGSTFQWRFGTDILIKDEYQTTFYNGTTTFYVAPISKNGCIGVAKQVSVITEAPEAAYIIDSMVGCKALTVKFTDKSNYRPKSDDKIVSYTWYFDKNDSIVTTLNEISHTYKDTGRYEHKLRIVTKDGCSSTTIINPDNWCELIRVGQKPKFGGDVSRKIICASGTDSKLGFYEKTTPKGISAMFGQFVLNTDASKTQSFAGAQSSGSCKPVPKDSIKISFYDAEAVGDYDLQLRLEHNGCFTDTVIKNIVTVKGPIMKFDRTMDCKTPYQYNLAITKKIDADNWSWKTYKVFNPSKELIDTTIPIKSVTRMIDFDTTTFNLNNTYKKSGDYSIVLYSEKKQTDVPGGVCRYEYSLPANVRNIKIRNLITVYDPIRSTPNSRTQVCWADTLKFDLSKKQDVIKFDDWNAWENNTIDSMKNGIFWVNGKAELINSKKQFYNIDSNYVDPITKSKTEIGFDSLQIKNKAIIDSMSYGVLIRAHTDNENACTDSAFIKLTAYHPKPNFITEVTNSCITTNNPFAVTFTDKSKLKRTDSSLIKRWWTTEGDVNNFEIATIVSDTYLKNSVYNPKLVVRDDIGCTEVYTTKNGIHPTAADIRHLGPSLVCLAAEPAPGVVLKNQKQPQGWLTLDASASNLYSKPDSVHWTVTQDETKWTKDTLTDGKADTLKYSITDPTITTTNILLESWTYDAFSKKACKNETLIPIDVRSERSKLRALTRDTIYCAPDTVAIYKIDDVTSVEWIRSVNGNAENMPKDDALSNGIRFERGQEGLQYVQLRIKTDYEGCTEMEVAYPVTVLSYKLTGLTLNTSKICVGQAVTATLNEGSKVDGYKFKWVLGDGEVDSVNRLETTHPYNNLQRNPDGSTQGKYTISFNLDLVKDCNDIPEPPSASFTIHGLDASFTRGVDDKTISGCVPFTVPFVSKKTGEGVIKWIFDGQTVSVDNPTYTFTKPDTTYNVTLIFSDNECSVPKYKPITTLKQPVLSFNTGSAVTCVGTEKTLEVTAQETTKLWWNANKYISDVSKTKLTFKPDSTTTLYLNTTSTDNCSRRDTFSVKVQQKPRYTGVKFNDLSRAPIYVYNPNDTLENYARKPWELMPFTDYKLHNDSVVGISYFWQPSTGLNCDRCASPTINLTEDITYTITMADSNNCFVVTDTAKLITVKETKLALPTAFTPNGDGDNDKALVRGWGIREFVDLRIYNRWGQLVYESSNLKEGWDGTYDGVPQNTDTFAYIIRAKDYTNAPVTQKGYITLVR